MTKSKFRYTKPIWLQLCECKNNVGSKSKWIIPLKDPREVQVLGYETLASDDVVLFIQYSCGVCRKGNHGPGF